MNDRERLGRAIAQLRTLGTRCEARAAYYEGRHPSHLGTEAWNRAYRERLKGVRDNQTRLVVDARVEPLIPVGYDPVDDTDPVVAADALWAGALIDAQAATVDTAVTNAKVAGEQTVVAVDVNGEGDVAVYALTPGSVWVQLDRGGAYLWAVHVWTSEDHQPCATLYTPLEIVTYTADSTAVLPGPEAFRETDRVPNPVAPHLPVAVIDESGSLIDDVAPLNDLLNKSLQTQAVVTEAYALPLRVYLGIDVFDPTTGETTAVIPDLNPATASRDVSLPTVADSEGGERKVLQLESPSPGVMLGEQEALRLTISRLAHVPASRLQLGSTPASGDALEIEYMPYVAAAVKDRRVYGPWLARVAALAVVRRRALLGLEVPAKLPKYRTRWAPVEATTQASRVEQVRTAVEAGMPLVDALVHFLGWAPDAAEAVADRAAAAQADRAAAAAGFGLPTL